MTSARRGEPRRDGQTGIVLARQSQTGRETGHPMIETLPGMTLLSRVPGPPFKAMPPDIRGQAEGFLRNLQQMTDQGFGGDDAGAPAVQDALSEGEDLAGLCALILDMGELEASGQGQGSRTAGAAPIAGQNDASDIETLPAQETAPERAVSPAAGDDAGPEPHPSAPNPPENGPAAATPAPVHDPQEAPPAPALQKVSGAPAPAAEGPGTDADEAEGTAESGIDAEDAEPADESNAAPVAPPSAEPGKPDATTGAPVLSVPAGATQTTGRAAPPVDRAPEMPRLVSRTPVAAALPRAESAAPAPPQPGAKAAPPAGIPAEPETGPALAMQAATPGASAPVAAAPQPGTVPAGPVMSGQAPVAMQAPNWPAALVSGPVVSLLDAAGGRMVLDIAPEELGRLTITLSVQGDTASVRFLAETPEAARLLADAERQLASELARFGMSLAGHETTTDRQQAGTGGGAAGLPDGDGDDMPDLAEVPEPGSRLVNLIA